MMHTNNREIFRQQAEQMEKDNKEAKPFRKAKRELWKSQSLIESLYNEENGKKIPRVSDVNQGGFDHLNHIFKGYMLGDCFLLTNLMGLARTNPDFIMKELIEVENDDKVKVWFYQVKVSDIKVKKDGMNLTYESMGSKVFYSVSKDEALKWQTSHKALWPVVIEIAYAKHLKAIIDTNKEKLEETLKTTLRPMMEKLIKESLPDQGKSLSTAELNDLIDKKINEELDKFTNQDTNLRQLLKSGGVAAQALTQLTGVKSRVKVLDASAMSNLSEDIQNELNFKGVDTSGIKKFQKSYSPEVLKMFNKIEKKLSLKQIITVGFRGINPSVPTSSVNKSKSDLIKTYDRQISSFLIEISRGLKSNLKSQIDNLEKKEMMVKEEYEKWLKEHNLELKQLSTCDEKLRKQFILDTVDLTKGYKVSKTQQGIAPAHSYLIVGTLEHEGYKYIVLKNPHDMATEINYKKSKHIPREVKLPEEINKVKNECMMELNHFYKKLSGIHYNPHK